VGQSQSSSSPVQLLRRVVLLQRLPQVTVFRQQVPVWQGTTQRLPMHRWPGPVQSTSPLQAVLVTVPQPVPETTAAPLEQTSPPPAAQGQVSRLGGLEPSLKAPPFEHTSPAAPLAL
jgi:hypothetical protein